jgi:hypothetical protein
MEQNSSKINDPINVNDSISIVKNKTKPIKIDNKLKGVTTAIVKSDSGIEVEFEPTIEIVAKSPKFQIQIDDKLFGVTTSNVKLNWENAYNWAVADNAELPSKEVIGKVYLQAKEQFGKGEWWSSSVLDNDKAYCIDFDKKSRSTKPLTGTAFAFYLKEI